jgi:hypothetical protein
MRVVDWRKWMSGWAVVRVVQRGGKAKAGAEKISLRSVHEPAHRFSELVTTPSPVRKQRRSTNVEKDLRLLPR